MFQFLTFGSTRVGRAMRFPGALWRRGWDDMARSRVNKGIPWVFKERENLLSGCVLS